MPLYDVPTGNAAAISKIDISVNNPSHYACVIAHGGVPNP